jgi:xylulokinase
MLARGWTFDPARRVSFHAGLRPGEILLFTGADSGGVVLDWFRDTALGRMPYEQLEDLLQSRRSTDAPIFLPYLTGVNPPDYCAAAKGAFLGIELRHDQADLAHAVEEGIAHLLRRNIDYLAPDGDVTEIVSTGGGAVSPYWSQLKADVCGVQVLVPREPEATCRGAAALALVEHGALGGLGDAAQLNQPEVVTYQPFSTGAAAARYQLFETYLARLYPAPAEGGST